MDRILTWLIGADALSGAEGWRFGFVAEYNNYVVLGLLAVLAGLVYLTVRSYRREGEHPPRVKATLAALRIAAIVLTMLVLLRPAIVLRYVNTVYTTLAVLVDDSLSMSFTDRYADAEQRAAVAETADETPDKLAETSRLEIARRALNGEDGPLTKLTAEHPVMVVGYSTDSPGRESYTRTVGTIDKVGDGKNPDDNPAPNDESDEAAELLGELSGAGFETDIAAALRDTLDRLQGKRVAGVVLVSDGQVTTRDPADRLAGALDYARRRGVPIYPVLVGDPTPPKNLAVTSLVGPREVRREAPVTMTATLAHRNLNARPVEVRLLRRRDDATEWTDTAVSEQVVLDGGEDRSRGVTTVELKFTPQELGRFVYRAVVEPSADEVNPRDNTADARLWVSDEKINVLLVGAGPDWEFRYLKRMLLRQPDLYRMSVWQQNADEEINQAASTGMKLSRLPQTLEELIGSPGGTPYPGYDVIILHDPTPTENGMDADFAEMLQTFVERHGGGLCYIAGTKNTAANMLNDPALAPLAALSPVVLAPNTMDAVEIIRRKKPESWRMILDAYGLDHPITRLADSAEDSQTVWRALPGTYWSHPVARIKPAARVLAVSENPVRRTDRNEPEPVIAVQPVGRGQVVYVGVQEIWRWRVLRDGEFHRRLWSNVVRFLATLQPRMVTITAGGDTFTAGERITVEAEVYDEKFEPLTAESFTVRLVDVETGDAQSVDLPAVEDRPGRYRKTITIARTGAYELTALADDPDAEQKVAGKRITVELPQAETRRTEADAELMRSLASRPENFLDVTEADRLASLIPSGKLTTYREDPRELWDSNLTLLLIVILLATEWILRKKYNMA